MISIHRASQELLIDVISILNSNAPLYQDIVLNPHNSDEINVDLNWAQANFATREFYIIKDQGQYLGFATYQNLKKFSYIGYFFIRYGFHNRGYGHSMMNFLVLRTMTEQLPEIRLFVNTKAPWAINFYKKVGFSILSEKKEEIVTMDEGIMEPFYVDNHIYMSRKV